MLAGLVGGAHQALAQREIGACIGLHVVGQQYQQNGQGIRERRAVMAHFGLTGAFDLGPNISFRPELLLVQLGTKHSAQHQYQYHTVGAHTDLLQYLMLPAVMVGRIVVGAKRRHQLVVGGGPYVAWLTYAESYKTTNSHTDDLEVGDGPQDDYRRFDAGMSLRAAYEYKPSNKLSGLTFFTGLTFTYGMLNVQPRGDEQNSRYNRCLGLTSGFRVRL